MNVFNGLDKRVFKRHAETLWDFCSNPDDVSSCDFILALGSADNNVAKRSAMHFHKKIAPLIVCSGGRGRRTGQWEDTEAQVFHSTLVDNEIPTHAIMLEQKSGNTFQNFFNVRTIFELMGRQDKTAVAVTQPFSVRRVKLTARRQWDSIQWLVDCAVTDFETFFERDPIDAAKRLTGEVYRIKSYAIKGDIATEHVTHDVYESYSYFRREDLIE